MSCATNLAIIDALIASPKKLASTELVWQKNPLSDQQALIKSAVEIDGEIRGNISFIANAQVFAGNHLTVILVLTYNDLPIQRLSFNPNSVHTNQPLANIPKRLRGIILPATVTRFHSWKNNRDFGFPPAKHFNNLPAAEVVTPSFDKLADALYYFFTQTNIESVLLTDPPFEQMNLV